MAASCLLCYKLWVWSLWKYFNLFQRWSQRSLQVTKHLSQIQQFSITVVTDLAYCPSWKQGCAIEPKQSPGTFRFKTISCLICTPVILRVFWPQICRLHSTVSSVILQTTRVGFLVFHLGLGITCLYEEIIIRPVTKRAPCQQNWTSILLCNFKCENVTWQNDFKAYS